MPSPPAVATACLSARPPACPRPSAACRCCVLTNTTFSLAGPALHNYTARLSPADMARLNKELSDLEPLVESLKQLRAKRTEVSGG